MSGLRATCSCVPELTRLVALRAAVVHMAVRVHHITTAKNALEPSVHHRAPEDLSELRHRRPDVVPESRSRVQEPGAGRPAALLPNPLGILVQRAVNLRRHIVHLQRKKALSEEVGHLLVRQEPGLAVQARGSGVWQLRQRDRIA